MNYNNHLPKVQSGKYLTFLSLLLLFLSSCSLFTIHGSGNIVTETRDVHDFSHVVFGGTGKLLLTQGEEESLKVTADDNLMDTIETEVRGDTLYIGLNDKPGADIAPSQPIRFNLNVQELAGLDIAGAVSAETGEIVADQLAIRASGLSTLQMAALEADKLTLHLSGANEVDVSGTGKAIEQELVINGSSNYHAPGLQSQTVSVTISGTGTAAIWATDFLDLTISGSGRLQYYGTPQISQQVSGNARIESLGTP